MQSSVVTTFLEIKADTFKLLFLYKRPVPRCEVNGSIPIVVYSVRRCKRSIHTGVFFEAAERGNAQAVNSTLNRVLTHGSLPLPLFTPVCFCLWRVCLYCLYCCSINSGAVDGALYLDASLDGHIPYQVVVFSRATRT